MDKEFLSERLPSQSMPIQQGWRLAIDEERNRIYVAGRRGKGTVIHAVGESGRLEKTFGADGELVLDWASRPLDMRVRPDGLGVGGLDGLKFFLVEVDPTGRILTRAAGSHAGSRANTGLVQDDGLILLKTSSIWDDAVGAEVMNSELFRYRASDSAADPAFGHQGVGTQGYVEYGSLQPGPSGALYACGYIQNSKQPHYYFPVIQRWRRDGTVDGAFGFSGRGMSASVEFGLQVCSGIAPSPSGVVMLIQRWGAEPKLIQFGADGKQDMRFGTSGVARLPSPVPAVIDQNDHAGIVVAQGEEGRVVITRLHP